MEANEERRVKRLLRWVVGLRQGLHPKDGGGRLTAFCRATGRKYHTVAQKLNLGVGAHGRGLAVVDIGLLVDVARWARDVRPVRLLLRLVEGRRARKSQRSTGIEVAA